MKITNNYEVKSIGEELLLVPKSREMLNNALILNPLAVQIYRLIEQENTMEEIQTILFSIYEVDRKVLLKDISDVIEIFIQNGVVSD